MTYNIDEFLAWLRETAHLLPPNMTLEEARQLYLEKIEQEKHADE